MDKNIILLALNLTLFILNLWTQNRTLRIQADIIKRDQDFVFETAKIIGRAVQEEKSEE